MQNIQKNNKFARMTRRIGNTTFKVKVICAESGETLEEKLLRMISSEYSYDGSGCKKPQTSRQSETEKRSA